MRSQNQRVLALVIAIVSLATVSAEAQGNWRPGDFGSWRFFMGIFEPEANSQFWDEYFMDFTGSPSSFQDLVFGTDYLWRTTRSGGLLFGASFYEGKSTLAYQDWVDADGQDISHTSSLGLSDLTAAYVLRFGRNSIRPYIGGGGGLLWWRFREEGYFIDFGAEDMPISATTGASSSRVATDGPRTSWAMISLASEPSISRAVRWLGGFRTTSSCQQGLEPVSGRGGIYAALERPKGLRLTRAGYIPPLHIRVWAPPPTPRLLLIADSYEKTPRLRGFFPYRPAEPTNALQNQIDADDRCSWVVLR
jgi:hypothetical protein